MPTIEIVSLFAFSECGASYQVDAQGGYCCSGERLTCCRFACVCLSWRIL